MFRKLKNLIYKLRELAVSAKEKAFVAFWAGTVGSYMAQNGLTYHDLLSRHAVWALIVGVVAHQFVYWTNNSKG